MRKSAEKILREVLAAIVSSKLTVNEMREFADLLSVDAYFSRQLADLIEDLSYKLGPTKSIGRQEPIFAEESYGGLTDLAYSIVQRKRISKAKLRDVFAKVGADEQFLELSKELTVRELVDQFLKSANPSQTDFFMQYLGVEMGQDAYLSGIDPRNRR